MRYKSLFLMVLLSLCSISRNVNADEQKKELQQRVEQKRDRAHQGDASIPREDMMRRREDGRQVRDQQGDSSGQKHSRDRVQNTLPVNVPDANKPVNAEERKDVRSQQNNTSGQQYKRDHVQNTLPVNVPDANKAVKAEERKHIRSQQNNSSGQQYTKDRYPNAIPNQLDANKIPRLDDRRKETRVSDKNARVETNSNRQKTSLSNPKRISKKKLQPQRDRLNVRVGVVRNQYIQKRTKEHIFDRYFWDGFRGRHRGWSFDSSFNWNTAVTWPGLAVWLSWNPSKPIYYYYGSDGAVYYGKTQDPSYLFLVSSGADFVEQAVKSANRPLPLSFDPDSWRPFGVFGLDQEDDSGELVEYISLAINQQGFLKGAYFNASTGETLEIQGSVDPKTQRASWKFVGQEWPVMDSGFYNLTNDEATLFVYRSYTDKGSRVMIRLN